MTDIAIIGGGAAGASLFGELLRRGGARVHWITGDRPVAGRGVAYASGSERHLLNVRAHGMGLFAGSDGEFLQFAMQQVDGVSAHDFLPRGLFGDFIEAQVRWCTDQALQQGRHFQIHGEDAVQLEPLCDGGYAVRLAGGALIKADAVVLALGALAPRPLKTVAREALQSGAYVLDPWRIARQEPAPRRVLVIGTGLTAVDTLLSAAERWPAAELVALSRHGQFPFEHAVLPLPPYPRQSALNSALLACDSPLAMFRHVRTAIEASPQTDWRSLVDGIRPINARLWRRLGAKQRRQFLRHLRWLWEAARHRVAPASASALEAMRDQGRLQVYAARVLGVDGHGPLQVSVRHRATQQLDTLSADLVVQATGLDTAVAFTEHTLLSRLLRDGLAMPDPLQLGVAAHPDGQLLNARGELQIGLYAIGALLRGNLWECSAMAEIRLAAQQLARRLAAPDEQVRMPGSTTTVRPALAP
ncbi:MAG TPA: FAD/NAD(P)-binding protein [Frateuria sp.]|uniref:FAD/NAD(P)-binding protein n=1 Tax=Frateuria sp. TaxID=2211372 RepID=UPI002D807BE9|nr:FAD/NAD(P)-binding protein [Frateuria sp.]HET6805403.1 FAD/NAD(P)-binding protein [Frateuria sp.]